MREISFTAVIRDSTLARLRILFEPGFTVILTATHDGRGIERADVVRSNASHGALHATCTNASLLNEGEANAVGVASCLPEKWWRTATGNCSATCAGAPAAKAGKIEGLLQSFACVTKLRRHCHELIAILIAFRAVSIRVSFIANADIWRALT
jgi:hypothetical protein